MATTWNPSDNAGGLTLSGGNLTAAAATNNSTWESVRSTNSPAKTTGKLHAEFSIVSSTLDQTWGIGIADGSATLSGQHVGEGTHGIVYAIKASGSGTQVIQNNVATNYTATNAVGDVIALEVDIGNKLIWFQNVTKASGWTDSSGGFTGNPGAGTGGTAFTATVTSGIMLAFGGYNYGSGSPTCTLNTATASGTVSSGFSLWDTPPPPTAYYVNSSTGLDSNPGTSALPWASLTPVNAGVYNGGDNVNFAGGQTFGGGTTGINLTTSNWGSNPTSANPVTFQSYGTGTATISSGSANGFNTINLPGVAINNLNFTGSGIAANAADGIHIENSQAGNTQLSGPSIANSVVTGYGACGIRILGSTGNSGFDTITLSGITVHDCTGGIQNTAYAGIIVYGNYLSGTPNFGTVSITNSTAYNCTGTAGGTHWTGSGIVVAEANSVTYTNLLVYNCGANCNVTGGGPVGIFIYDTNSFTVSKCEAHHIHTGGAHDGDGFNCDTNNGGAGLLEKCYSHDNDGFGYLADCYIGQNSVTVRDCIFQNNLQNSAVLNGAEVVVSVFSSGLSVALNLYNCTFYSAKPCLVFGTNQAITVFSGRICNNIFYSATGGAVVGQPASGDTVGNPTNLIFDGNDYYSVGTFSLYWNGTTYTSLASWKAAFTNQEPHSGTFSTANPLLSNPGGGGTIGVPGYAPPQPTAYALQSSSPMIGVGLNLNTLYSINPGTSDYYGNTIPHGIGTGYNVGAYGASNVCKLNLLGVGCGIWLAKKLEENPVVTRRGLVGL